MRRLSYVNVGLLLRGIEGWMFRIAISATPYLIWSPRLRRCSASRLSRPGPA